MLDWILLTVDVELATERSADRSPLLWLLIECANERRRGTVDSPEVSSPDAPPEDLATNTRTAGSRSSARHTWGLSLSFGCS